MDLSRFPRRVYTPNATPIEFMPNLSKELGQDVKLWIKRDDQLGMWR
jgi:D-cysteine desulfhydrase